METTFFFSCCCYYFAHFISAPGRSAQTRHHAFLARLLGFSPFFCVRGMSTSVFGGLCIPVGDLGLVGSTRPFLVLISPGPFAAQYLNFFFRASLFSRTLRSSQVSVEQVKLLF